MTFGPGSSIPLRMHRVVLAAALAAVLAGCGGGDAGRPSTAATVAPDDAGSVDVAGTSTTVVQIDTGAAAVIAGTTQRPDWLPVWVLLPEGMQITASVWEPETGDGFVTGVVAGEDPQLLYDQALFMAQSGGYVFVESIETAGSGFLAGNPGDDSSVTFTAVGEQAAVMWSMYFGGLEGDAPSEATSQASAGDLDRRGSLSLTVPGISSRTDGACLLEGGSQAAFVGDDGVTTFEVAQDGPVTGEIALDVEGSSMSWVPSPASAHMATEITPSWVYYEGDFLVGSETVFGVVQIDCQ